MAYPFLTNIDLKSNSILNPILNPLATAPANAAPYYIYTSTGSGDAGTVYVNVGTYSTPVWKAIGAVSSVNGHTGVVVLTQDDVGDGATYVRTHNDLTNALVTLINGALQKSGGTMSGAIAMGSNKITGLADGTADGDAVNLGQVADMISTNTAIFRGTYATKAALLAVAWQTTDPTAPNYVTNNDYAVVLDDETQNDECWRYVYVTGTGWEAQYRINESPLTQAQLDALNSGITAALVTQIGTNQTDISNIKDGTTIDSFGDVETALAGKAPTDHASANTTYGVGSGTNYGHVQLSDSTSSTSDASDGIAATPAAVKAAYDLANGKSTVTVTTGSIGTSATTATVSYSGTVINAFATMGGAEVVTDITYGTGTVTFTVAAAPSSAITCTVVAIS